MGIAQLFHAYRTGGARTDHDISPLESLDAGEETRKPYRNPRHGQSIVILHPHKTLVGDYALNATASMVIAPTNRVMTGTVHFASGRRSPESGMRTSGLHEVGHVLRGRLRIETASEVYEVGAGDSLVMCPAEPHSTTALQDSEIFFVLLDPTLSI